MNVIKLRSTESIYDLDWSHIKGAHVIAQRERGGLWKLLKNRVTNQLGQVTNWELENIIFKSTKDTA